MKDLGDELLDMDLREVFQAMIDRGMVDGLPPGTPWYNHIRVDGMEPWSSDASDDDELLATLVRDRRDAEQELVNTYTPEARAKLVEAHKRVRMARKLASD
jgi:hypothetical protein